MLVSRRTFFFGSLALPALAAKKKPAALRPGILLILVDELPAFMLGAYGNKQVRTPNLDLLANMGMRFVNHFACAPAPVAGRNTLLTGRTPMQLGEAGALSAADVPLARILTAAGYVSQEGDANFLRDNRPVSPSSLRSTVPACCRPTTTFPKNISTSTLRSRSWATRPICPRSTRPSARTCCATFWTMCAKPQPR